eukprot:CAMPEP_0204650272 /NCGR_PEP_ID=MMETSP0718-20130828/11268_1 /ASSEMBLY_ACC=CAM_ASM_000674 /TAXON_ID=230516 /ORGANISM="Chaetoceros curvisetus" /LENGTH=306 /DNA_ID=CAMNT_0051673639 /DNA_START=31 /DNA_END=952 /DNA_ORIENTATION=+
MAWATLATISVWIVVQKETKMSPNSNLPSKFKLSSSFATSCSRNPNVLDGKDGITSASVSSSSTHESDGSIKPSTSSINTAQTFILVDTRHPGNVGAAARAMKTMGFSNLILVTPHDERVLGRKKCIDGASGALDVLRNATVVDSLEEALQQCHTTIVNEDGDVISSDKLVVCGTGMPVDMQNDRPKVTNYAAPRPYFQQILSSGKDESFDQDDDNAIADEISNGDKDDNGIHMIFIFGNEKYGMKAEDIDNCHVMLGIPTNPAFGSLNVASAVQLIAYDWREAIGGFGGPLTSSSAATCTSSPID